MGCVCLVGVSGEKVKSAQMKNNRKAMLPNKNFRIYLCEFNKDSQAQVIRRLPPPPPPPPPRGHTCIKVGKSGRRRGGGGARGQTAELCGQSRADNRSASAGSIRSAPAVQTPQKGGERRVRGGALPRINMKRSRAEERPIQTERMSAQVTAATVESQTGKSAAGILCFEYRCRKNNLYPLSVSFKDFLSHWNHTSDFVEPII
ncbi:hypothetical protein FQA47_004126 [Oryzias melastigma]|uniref:Uncharacterized protein n=1 Tax=Oryzias melastigma TaxID=30732 RepID=A0A834FFU5_ORYME|nr:hypothetical protein FQA47_004126 [Oryzias melastigma]